MRRVAVFGGIFAFLGRQAGKVLNVAFGWATIALFGRVPKERQPYLSAMAAGALAWPIVVLGLAFPSVGTFLLAFVTLPHWAEPMVRPVMLALAVLLPLAVGSLSTRVIDPAPKGAEFVKTITRGYVSTPALFVVFCWMLILAPVSQLRALARRWQAEHISIAIAPDGYDAVVDDLVDALARARIRATARPASWVWSVPGRILAAASGRDITSLVPKREIVLDGDQFDLTIHPMDLALRGKHEQFAHARSAITRELTFTEAYQTWTTEAQQVEDELRAAARRERPIAPIRTKVAGLVLERDEWEVLYRLLLQVELRLASPQAERDAAGVGRASNGRAARVRESAGALASAVRPTRREPTTVELFLARVEDRAVFYIRREAPLAEETSAASVARSLAEVELHEKVGGGDIRATGARPLDGRRILTYCLVTDRLDEERAERLELPELERLMRGATPTGHPTELVVLWHSLREVGIAA